MHREFTRLFLKEGFMRAGTGRSADSVVAPFREALFKIYGWDFPDNHLLVIG